MKPFQLSEEGLEKGMTATQSQKTDQAWEMGLELVVEPEFRLPT